MRILRWLEFNVAYFRNPPWDTGITPPELSRFIKSHPPGHALDIGCGTGTNSITLAKNGWQVTGIDYALPAIRLARKKAGRAGVQVDFSVGDVTQIKDLPAPFDLILDIGCYHSLGQSERRIYRTKLEDWLAPNGTFMIYLFTRDDLSEIGPGIRMTELEELISRFHLVERQDGTERGQRSSSWLTLARTI